MNLRGSTSCGGRSKSNIVVNMSTLNKLERCLLKNASHLVCDSLYEVMPGEGTPVVSGLTRQRKHMIGISFIGRLKDYYTHMHLALEWDAQTDTWRYEAANAHLRLPTFIIQIRRSQIPPNVQMIHFPGPWGDCDTFDRWQDMPWARAYERVGITMHEIYEIYKLR